MSQYKENALRALSCQACYRLPYNSMSAADEKQDSQVLMRKTTGTNQTALIDTRRMFVVPIAALRLFVPSLLLILTLASCGSSSDQPQTHVTPRPTIVPPVIYSAIGASDALGVGATNPPTDGYVPRLIARLPKGSLALNVGVGGITIHDALQQELPQAIAFHPTLITVWLIGNDFRDCTSLTQYAADLTTLLTQLQMRTKAKIFVADTPDMSLLPYFSQEHGAGGGACVAGASVAQIHALVLQWNAVIDPIIVSHGAVLVDLYHTALAAHPEYISTRDGFHPSSLGYEQLANYFWAAITAHHAVPGA